jgi:thiamine kinase-like enzyme
VTVEEQMRYLCQVDPLLRGDDVEWQQLHGGLAHVTYVVSVDGRRVVVKFLTEEMDQFGLMVPMEHLIRNTTCAGECGVGARVLSTYPELPAIVLEFIDGKTLCPADLGDPGYIPRLARSVRKLHTTAPPFSNRIDIFRFLDDYLGLVESHRMETPTGLLEELPTIRRIQEALVVNALPLVPSNNDLLARNVMDDGTIRLIDYDFSGMNDPMFDLGDLAMEGDYDPDQVRVLCDTYFAKHVPAQYARARLFGVAAQFTWSLLFVGMAKLLSSKPAETFDYWNEAVIRWDWTREKLAAPDLETTIAAAAAPGVTDPSPSHPR